MFRDVGDSLTYMGRSDVAIISSQKLKNHCSLNVLDNSGITYNMKLLYRSYACKRFIAVTFTHLPDPCSSKGSHTCSSAGYILAKLGLKVWGSIFLGLTILFPKGGVGKVFFFFFLIPMQFEGYDCKKKCLINTLILQLAVMDDSVQYSTYSAVFAIIVQLKCLHFY